MAPKDGTTKAGKGAAAPQAPGTVSAPPPLDPNETWVVLSAFVFALAVYLRTLHPSVAGGDAGELMTVAHELGTPHPPGYPTFALLTQAAESAVRFVSPSTPIALAQNAFHACLSAGAVALLCRATSRLTGSAAAGLAASFVFGFAPNVWTYAIVTEVFALNNLLMCLLVALAVDFWRAKALAPESLKWRVRWSAFACGLALTNQHTSVLYVLPIVLWVVASDLKRYLRDSAALFGFFFLGMSPYVYLPISSALFPSTNSWGRLHSWTGFWDHFFRKEYGTFSLASKESTYRVNNFERAWRFYMYDTAEQTLWCLWPLALLGAVVILRRTVGEVRQRPLHTLLHLPVEALLLMTWFAYSNFFHYLANLPIDQPLFYGVQQRFWLQPLILVAVALGIGFDFLARRLKLPSSLVFAVAMCIAVAPIAVHFETQDESQNYYVRDFGIALLRPLPPGSILLTKGDIQINSARFVQVCEGFRPDVTILDQELLTYAWYNDVVRVKHPHIVLPGISYYPGKKGLYSMREFLEANMKKNRRVFVAWGWKEGDPSTTGQYTLASFGSATEVLRNSKVERLKTDLKLRARRALEVATSVPFNLSSHRIPPPGRYSTVSWENVVREDFQTHLIGVAFDAVRAAEMSPAPIDANVVLAVQRVGAEDCPKMDFAAIVGSSPTAQEEARLYCALINARHIYDYVFATFDPSRFAYYVRRNYGVAIQVMMSHEPDPARKKALQVEMLEQMKQHLAEHGKTLEAADRENVQRVVEHSTRETQ